MQLGIRTRAQAPPGAESSLHIEGTENDPLFMRPL